MSVPVFGFYRFRFVFALLIAGFLSLFVITPVQPSVSSPDLYYDDLNSDIPWSSSGTSTAAHVQEAFNNARGEENSQLATSIPPLTLPNQSTWDAMSDNEKAEWLVYRERVDRGLKPLHGFESNVISIAQYYADYLLDNDKWGHYEDGKSPSQRLNTNPTINGCHDSLGVAENLWAELTSGTSIELPLERSIYTWLYDDGPGWGHRHMVLWYPYDDNSGPAGKEGFMGIGRASGPYMEENFAEVIVMNVFDPCSTWVYPTPPPTLISPGNGTTTSDTTPYFYWSTSSGAILYQIQVDDSSSFTSPVINALTSSSNFTPGSGLSSDTYYWQVRALDAADNWTAWTTIWSFTVDTGPVCDTPGKPSLVAPGNGSTTDDITPYFNWNTASYSNEYQIQVDDSSSFSSPAISTITSNSYYTPSTGLSDGTYYWRVRGHNNSGSCDIYGSWSIVWTVTIDTSPLPIYDNYLPIVVKN